MARLSFGAWLHKGLITEDRKGSKGNCSFGEASEKKALLSLRPFVENF